MSNNLNHTTISNRRNLNLNQIIDDAIHSNVIKALEEDLGGSVQIENDLSASLISNNNVCEATIIFKEDGILCGTSWATKVFNILSEKITIDWNYQDGDYIKAGEIICSITGPSKEILIGERSALNFLQTLSGCSTKVNEYCRILKNSKIRILDTRKTIPGLRTALKYAVKCGGGLNHRHGLYDAFLIKENHITSCGSITEAVNKAKSIAPNKLIEVEVENINELKEALKNNVDVIMLDNFSIEMIHKATEINKQKVPLEVSGDINLNNLTQYLDTNVDYISIGALTKNIKALDLSLRIK